MKNKLQQLLEALRYLAETSKMGFEVMGRGVKQAVAPRQPISPLGYISPTSSPTATPTPFPSQTPTPTPFQGRNPAVNKFDISGEVRGAMDRAANAYGVNPDLLYDIALQESGFNPQNINQTPEGIAAGNPRGLFQITEPTMRTVENYASAPGSSLSLPNRDLLDPYTNSLIASYLIKMGQLGRWDASKGVWGGYYSPEEISPYYAQTPGRLNQYTQ